MSITVVGDVMFIAQADDQCMISEAGLKTVISLCAAFYRKLVIADTAALCNSKLCAIFMREPRWLKSRIIELAVRDTAEGIKEVFEQNKTKWYSCIEDEDYVGSLSSLRTIPLSSLRTIPLSFSDLAENFVNKIEVALKDRRGLARLGLSPEIVEKLTCALVEEYKEKKIVTRSTIFTLADQEPNHRIALQTFGKYHYWNNVPAVLSVANSAYRMPNSPEDVFCSELQEFMAAAVAEEIDQLTFPILPAFRDLSYDEILDIRLLRSFKKLNDLLVSQTPSRSELWAAFVEHARSLSGYVIKRGNLGDSMKMMHKIVLYLRKKEREISVANVGLSIVPSLTVQFISALVSLGFIFLPDPAEEYKGARGRHLRMVKREIFVTGRDDLRPLFDVEAAIFASPSESPQNKA